MLSQRIEIEKRPRRARRPAARGRAEPRAVAAQARRHATIRAAARKEVEAALEAAPENPAALAALAQLHLKENDFAAYAAARVREARALRGTPGRGRSAARRGARLSRAGAAPDKARACFEEALREEPSNAEALRALAALLAAEANWDEARARARAPAGDDRGTDRRRGRCPDGSGPHRLGGLQRRAPRRSAGSTRRWRWSPTTCPPILADRRHLLQGGPVGAGREAPHRGGAPAAQPAPAGRQAVPAPRRGAREARQARGGLPPARRGGPDGPRAAARPSCRSARTDSAPAAGARPRCTSAASPITRTPRSTPTRWRTRWPTRRRPRSSCATPSARSSCTSRR